MFVQCLAMYCIFCSITTNILLSEVNLKLNDEVCLINRQIF